MKFLIDEDLPHSLVETFQKHGHMAVHIRDIGLRGVSDKQIAEYIKREHLCLLTGDFDFSDIRNYPPSHFNGIIVLALPRYATAEMINQLVSQFLGEKALLAGLPRKLAIVEWSRVRLRA